MDRIELSQSVGEILIEHLGVDAAEITPSAKVVDDLGADSLDFVEMVLAMEERFNLEIDDQDVEKLTTVQDVIDYLARRLSL